MRGDDVDDGASGAGEGHRRAWASPPRGGRARVAAGHALVLAACAACFPVGPALDGDSDPRACDESFEDHTIVDAIDRATFASIAEDPAADPQRVDFVISSLTEPAIRTVRFEDASFYDFHDEWYWFRLLNGVAACGATTTPEDHGPFATIDDVYARFDGDDDLPLDLERATGDRLVSPSFYTLALRAETRVYGVGTVLRHLLGDGESEDAWTFELEFVDDVSRDDLARVFDALDGALPAGADVMWTAVSPAQTALADALDADDDPLGARVLRVGETPDGGCPCACVRPSSSRPSAAAPLVVVVALLVRRRAPA